MREQHNIWNELKAAIEDTKSTSLPALPQRNMTYARPSNTMDVNAVHVDALTAKERDKLSKEGHCFKCKKQGHISHKLVLSWLGLAWLGSAACSLS